MPCLCGRPWNDRSRRSTASQQSTASNSAPSPPHHLLSLSQAPTPIQPVSILSWDGYRASLWAPASAWPGTGSLPTHRFFRISLSLTGHRLLLRMSRLMISLRTLGFSLEVTHCLTLVLVWVFDMWEEITVFKDVDCFTLCFAIYLIGWGQVIYGIWILDQWTQDSCCADQITSIYS